MDPHDLPDDTSATREQAAQRLRDNLARAKELRCSANADPGLAQDRLRLRQWQAGRLARTHRDLLDSAEFGQAAAFFLSDLYGPKDFSERDEEVERILPMIVAVLPTSGVNTVALAVEVDALSEELDALVAANLRRAGRIDSIDEAAYAEAYRGGSRAQRQRQIALIRGTGTALARLTRIPLIGTTLRLMRGPAHLAGLGELHEFLERGFSAFKSMRDPFAFLDIVERRESEIMERLFAAQPEPFEVS